MSFDLTTRALQASQSNEIKPNLVIEIDGIDTLFGVILIKKIVRVGDFEIGQPGIFVGGSIIIEDQESLISFQAGTSSEIRQTLNIDKGTNESVTTMRVALIDKNLKATKLITPGEFVEDVLGRKIKIWLGFNDTNFKDDYIIIFRGIISAIDAKSGVIVLDLASPDTKKKSATFPKGSTKLNGVLHHHTTEITVDSTASFLAPYLGPNGQVDPDLTLCVRIDDEIIKYESVTGTTFGTLTRGYLFTDIDSHDDEASVESFYILEGNAIDLSLKLLLSGKNGPFLEDIKITNFVRIDPLLAVENAIFFQDVDLMQEYNLQIGDYITTTGASNGANNVSLKQIVEIIEVENGYYIVVDGVSFVEEVGTSGVIEFRSQYDVWGPNAGCGLGNDEVDIAEHLSVKSKYLSSADYKIYLKDTIEDSKEFLSEQLYNPVSAFAIPRKAQSSVGVHVGPIPGVNIKTLDDSNVLNAENLSLTRSTTSNFFNSVIYRFEEDVLEERFKSGYVTIDGTSISRIPVGNKPLIIDSKGLRDLLSGSNVAQVAGSRRLRKYKFGAEHIKGLEVNFKTGFDIEVGDKCIVDIGSLKITDINTASRNGEPRLFEVSNKTLKIKEGKVILDVVDTNFSLDVRYALIGPASKIKTGISQTQFVIKPSFNTSKYGNSEYKKWLNFIGAFVKVHNADFSVSGTGYISSINNNTFTLDTALGFTPLEDYILEFGDYDNQPTNIKLVYGFMSDANNNFADGKSPYQMS
jgi:hypothetical protein